MNVALDQRGTALLAALAVVLMLLPVGAFVVLQCRTDWLIQHNLHAEVEAFYVAEAGLEHAVAEIGPGIVFDSLLAGPDHVVGNADDGVFPFREGTPAGFPAAPFRYDVGVAKAGSDMVSVVSTGVGSNGATKVVSALVRRSPLPIAPGALYAEGDVSTLDMGSAGFVLSGLDHQVSDPPSAATGSAAPVPALSGVRADAEALLRQRLAADSAQRLVGAGGTPSTATVSPIDVQPYATAAANRPGHIQASSVTAGEDVVLGTVDAPQLAVVAGDLSVAGRLTGNGVLVVGGTLHVTGAVAFTGLVVAMGGIVLEPSSTVTVVGGLWCASSIDSRLQLRGSGGIVYSSAALAAVDRAFTGLLPHAAIVAAWQEQL